MRTFVIISTIFIVTLSVTSISSGQTTILLGPLRKGDTRITVYDEANFGGNSEIFDVLRNGCTSVSTKLNDKISSISFNPANHVNNRPNCVLAYRNPNCQGTQYVFTDATPCLNNLADPNCDSDKTISSFKACTRDEYKGK